jgi:hypothetical protein
MRPVIETLIEPFLPDEIESLILVHQGKQDLRKSIPVKLKAWQNPYAHFIVLHDQDSSNCKKLKKQLQDLCPPEKLDSVLIRIVCTELESWFFGDLPAVEQAFPHKRLKHLANRATYRLPDEIRNPAKELAKLIPEYQKTGGARAIAPFLDVKGNTSVSFQVFVQGVTNVVEKLKAKVIT